VAGCSLGDTGGFWARNTRQGESIAQRSRRSQRGTGQWPGVLWRRPWHLGRNTRKGKASHRGHGGHRGGMASGRVFFGRYRRLLGEKHTLGGPGSPNRGFPCSFAGQRLPP
jgi:hypothetical protein